jgi:hypothetical protein
VVPSLAVVTSPAPEMMYGVPAATSRSVESERTVKRISSSHLPFHSK